jgi:tyrosinase
MDLRGMPAADGRGRALSVKPGPGTGGPTGPSTGLRRRIAACLMVLAIVQTAGYGSAPATPANAATAGSFLSPSAGDDRVRKNLKALTAQERRDFVEAVLALKSAPSPFDPELNYYDQFVAWHLSLYPCGMGHEMMRAHGGPMFPPWHRLFLLRFENALREVSGKPITVPYWDWTDPASTPVVFAEDFMGGDGDPNDGFAVTTGPFRKGLWSLRVQPIGLQWSASATPYLTRRFGSLPGFTSLPTPADVSFVLDRPRYDVAPYDATSDPNLSFRNALEGFWQRVGPATVSAGLMACGPDGVMMTATGPGMHNLVHAWVGGLLGMTPRGPKAGTMSLPTSVNDPLFFLHHSNIDRLWAEWQEEHGVDSYEPASCEGLLKLGCRANTRTDRMHPPFEATPADVADIRALGYRYESMAAEPGSTTGAGLTAPAAAGAPFRCEVGQLAR